MALQINYNFNGCPLAAAYCRVMDVAASRSRGSCSIVVDLYASAEAAAAGSQPLTTELCPLPYANQISVASAYAHLKTLSEYAGAVDV